MQPRDAIGVVHGTCVSINVSLSNAPGCPAAGDGPAATELAWIRRFTDLGVRGFALYDTTGMTFPSKVREPGAHVRERFGARQLTLHLRDMRGRALTNTLTALDCGHRPFRCVARRLPRPVHTRRD